MQPLWKTVWKSRKKLKIELPCDPAISPLGIHLEKMKTLIQNYTCTPLFIAALFTIAKTWRQTKCPTKEEWIKKMWCMCVYIHTYIYIEYYSAIKNERLPFVATWTDLNNIILSELSQIEKIIM